MSDFATVPKIGIGFPWQCKKFYVQLRRTLSGIMNKQKFLPLKSKLNVVSPDVWVIKYVRIRMPPGPDVKMDETAPSKA
jgi:hypothetical protein